MSLYCPNCSAPVSEGEASCRNCGALFGPASAWQPTRRPGAPFSESAKPPAAPPSPPRSESAKRRRVPGLPAGKKFYGFMLAVMLFGIAATFLASPLAKIFPPVRGAAMAQALQVVLTIKAVVNPVPAMLQAFLPQLLTLAFLWLQIALVVRRLVVCIARRELIVPVALTTGWKVLLLIVMLSWFLGMAIFLSPVLLGAFGANRLAYAMQIGNIFFTGLLFIPAANLFGITFLVVEVLSASREGWLPRKASPVVGATSDAQAGKENILFRRAAAVGVTLGLALLVLPPLWSLFPAGPVYERLCRERTGERVYQSASVKSYVLVGEGASSDGFHLHHALEDVTSRRVEFVEVVTDRKNNHQANAFIPFLGTHDPKAPVLRASLGPAGSADCVRRLASLYETKLEVQPDQCLRLTPAAATTSRYRVEALNGEWATWYTPHVLAYGARVVDGEGNVTVGEHLRFGRSGLLPFFLVGDKNLTCPPVYGFRPTRVHRKALLGEK